MLILPYLLVVLVSFIITWYLKTNKPLRNFPAGPRQLPFLGNLLSVGLNLKDAFNRWRNTYGPIVGFKLGQQPCIVISDFHMLNEAFKDDRFCGRPTNLKDHSTLCFNWMSMINLLEELYSVMGKPGRSKDDLP